MMKFGMNIKQRDIVLIPFPYSDLSATKKRPVVILSNSNYHKDNNDMICCAITSSKKEIHRGVLINNFDLEEGNLKTESVIKPSKVFTVLRKIIVKKVGTLKIEKIEEVIKNLKLDIEIDR